MIDKNILKIKSYASHSYDNATISDLQHFQNLLNIDATSFLNKYSNLLFTAKDIVSYFEQNIMSDYRCIEQSNHNTKYNDWLISDQNQYNYWKQRINTDKYLYYLVDGTFSHLLRFMLSAKLLQYTKCIEPCLA